MKIVFMGTPAAAVLSLERLHRDGHEICAVYTQPDRPSGRGNKLTSPPVKEWASARALPVLQPLKIKTPEAVEIFRSHNADVAVVTAYGRILPKEYLCAFPHGAINVHFALLPRYRGAAPVNWAIVSGEPVTGVTTMQMDEGLDTGDILLQRQTDITEDETSIELMQRLAVIGADLLSETLSRIGEITPIPQDHSQASHAPVMQRSDGLIEWSMDAVGIANRVRGFQPFPTAYTFSRGRRLTIWRARAEQQTSGAIEGAVVSVERDSFLVACGGSSLWVLEVQPEGKRRMSVRDFLNGTDLSVGDVLGQ
jgi:methionyl-tRNA formyltransferase